MPSYAKTPQFEHGRPGCTGVLVVNLGTPDAPTAGAVRRFLRQFLSDPRVVEYPRLLWWLILNLIILVIRPPRSAAAYRKIWTAKGSPLLIHSNDIVEKLRDRLNVPVELGMTYGKPSVDTAVDSLLAAGAERIVVLPLFPQYSGTTTAAVFDTLSRKLGRLRWVPELRTINGYHDEPGYIEALAASVREHRERLGHADKLVMSFHGVPKRLLEAGDPYYCFCHKTARLLAEALALEDDEWVMTFQSRVGREEWLQPYTEDTLDALGREACSRVDVVCPGFSTDCLETLEEIAMQNAEAFSASGGGELRYIPALNARDDHMDFLASLVARYIASPGDSE